jgi:two-component system, NarL family, sensor histidine kinase DesK
MTNIIGHWRHPHLPPTGRRSGDCGMTAVLALHQPARLGWPEVRRSRVEVGLKDSQDADRLIRYALVGVAVFGTIIPLMGVYTAVLHPAEPGHALQVFGLYALIVPPTLWLLLASARNTRPSGRWWVFAAVSAVVILPLPVVQMEWIRALALLATLVLVLVPRPWSVILVVGLAGAAASLAVLFGHAERAGYYTLTVLINAIPLAVLVWLAAKSYEVRDARRALAREAVIRERVRIDDELRRTLGSALSTIVARAQRAGALAQLDPTEAAHEVAAVTDHARSTLAEARRIVRRYQTVSLRAELAVAAALLSAAGIQTRVELPEDDWPDDASEPLRSALHARTAHLLESDTIRDCVITVRHRAGQVRLELVAR